MPLKRRGDVVVSRVGMVTSGGVGIDEAWSAMRDGRGTPSPITFFPPGLLTEPMGFEVPGWKAARFWKDRKLAYYTRAAQFALKASEECLEGVPAQERSGIGVIVGTRYATVNNVRQLLEEPDFMTPIKFLSALPSSTPTNVSLSLGLHGITTAVSSSAAGVEALICARDLVATGQARSLLAGGAEELGPEAYAGCLIARAVAGAAGEGGLVPGEAAAMVLVESRETAAEAERSPLAWIAGSGAAFAPNYGTTAGVDAGARALAAALAEAGIPPTDVDAVFVGANGHAQQDEISRGVIARVFGAQRPVVVALKAWVGETFGAFGALAAGAAALSLRDTIVPGGVQPPRCRTILIHDYGCDGGHAGLILRHPDACPINQTGD